MKKLITALLAVFLIISIASAAILTEYFQDERTVEVAPWMSVEVNNDPTEITYGDTLLHDYSHGISSDYAAGNYHADRTSYDCAWFLFR